MAILIALLLVGITLLLVAVVIGLCYLAYTRKVATDLTGTKPRFCTFPEVDPVF